MDYQSFTCLSLVPEEHVTNSVFMNTCEEKKNQNKTLLLKTNNGQAIGRPLTSHNTVPVFK